MARFDVMCHCVQWSKIMPMISDGRKHLAGGLTSQTGETISAGNVSVVIVTCADTDHLLWFKTSLDCLEGRWWLRQRDGHGAERRCSLCFL